VQVLQGAPQEIDLPQDPKLHLKSRDASKGREEEAGPPPR